jgi:hypothetical protein
MPMPESVGKVTDAAANHSGKIGLVVGAVAGLIAGRYPEVANLLTSLVKLFGW